MLREAGNPEPSAESPGAVAARDEALAALGARVTALHGSLPAGTLLVVACGQGDTQYVRYLEEQRYRRRQDLDGLPPWTQECEEHLAAVAQRAMTGCCFVTVKQ